MKAPLMLLSLALAAGISACSSNEPAATPHSADAPATPAAKPAIAKTLPEVRYYVIGDT